MSAKFEVTPVGLRPIFSNSRSSTVSRRDRAPKCAQCSLQRLRYLRVAAVTSQETVKHFHARLWEPQGLPPLSPALSRDGVATPRGSQDHLQRSVRKEARRSEARRGGGDEEAR